MEKHHKEETILPHISYHKVLDQIRDGIFITDTSRMIVYWNHGAEELTGFGGSDIVGHYCYELGHLCKRDHKGHHLCEAGSCPLEKTLEQGTAGIYPHIVFMETSECTELPVSINVGPIHDVTGKIVGGICVFRDMREEYRQRQLAGEIQKKMITLGKIRKNGMLIETLYKPVEEIGGDFLEAFFLDDMNLVATVADATGHGISASLFTVIYKTLLHSSFASYHDPAEVLRHVNVGFLQTTQIEGYYLTASMCIFNPVTRRGKISSAGHPPALIFRKKERGYNLHKVLSLHSVMIGVEENVKYQEMDFQLEKGDFLLLSSDGLMEAEGEDGKPLGLEGLSQFMNDYDGYNLLGDLMTHLERRSRYVELQDDVSLVRIEPVGEPDGR